MHLHVQAMGRTPPPSFFRLPLRHTLSSALSIRVFEGDGVVFMLTYHLRSIRMLWLRAGTTLCSLPESTMLNTMNIPLIGVAQQLTGISSNPDIVKTLMGVRIKVHHGAPTRRSPTSLSL